MALVTVTYDCERELRGLLASVERHLPDASVIVVDSGSRDATVAAAREWRGGSANVIELGENVGFPRASTWGWRQPLNASLPW
jgi:glycosyltransferase involved in cell wall biosynthesis